MYAANGSDLDLKPGDIITDIRRKYEVLIMMTNPHNKMGVYGICLSFDKNNLADVCPRLWDLSRCGPWSKVAFVPNTGLTIAEARYVSKQRKKARFNPRGTHFCRFGKPNNVYPLERTLRAVRDTIKEPCDEQCDKRPL